MSMAVTVYWISAKHLSSSPALFCSLMEVFCFDVGGRVDALSNFGLIVAVVGDNYSSNVHQPEIVNQLSKKLGVKVVLQMESSDGEVMFEDTVATSLQTGAAAEESGNDASVLESA